MPQFAISDILVEAVWFWAVIGACLASIDSHHLSWISSGLDQGRGSDSHRLSWISSEVYFNGSNSAIPCMPYRGETGRAPVSE